ncbi:MAG: fibronectin type III domain-containing protein [Chloroflexi bacterium]|nr:fibronectin type III domain-containing protein [Chloroflexota bacterium]
MPDDRRSRIIAAICSWRCLVSAILIALSCAYLVPIERSMGLFASTHANAGVLSSGSLEPPVTLLANVAGPTAIKLDWPASPSTFATGYTVYRLNPGDADYTLIATVMGHGSTTLTDNGLAPASMYVYRVEAIATDWNSAPSPIAWATTP